MTTTPSLRSEDFPGLDRYRAFLFDLDGTLLDTRPELVHACKRAFAQVGAPFSEETAWNHCGHGAYSLVRTLWPDIDDEMLEKVRNLYLDCYEEELGKRTDFLPGMRELVGYAQERGLPMSIVTNKSERFTHPLLKVLELDHLFTHVVTHESFAEPKPAPHGLLHCVEAWGLTPQECLFWGDSATDAEAGLRARIPTVIVRTGFVPAAESEDWGAWVFDNIRDVPTFASLLQ